MTTIEIGDDANELQFSIDYTEIDIFKAKKKFAKHATTDNYLYTYSVSPFTFIGYPLSL